MKKISSIIERVSIPQFPCKGQNGYGGEQDGTRVCLSGPHQFVSWAAADAQVPNGVPDYVNLHWGEYRPNQGWFITFGWWSNEPDEGDGNPFRE